MADGWSDRDGRAVDAPEPPPDGGSHWAAIGDFQGAGYARNAFTAGTEQEVGFLVGVLELGPETRVLDVGCGTGRHLRALAQRGIPGIGVDLSSGLLGASGGLPVVQADARRLPLEDGATDVALALCQGGFGVTPSGDVEVLRELARVLRPGGRLALTAFSLAFAVRWMGADGDEGFHVERAVHHQQAEVRGPDAEVRRFDLWTTTYSAPHLRLLVEESGFTVDVIAGVEPGAFGLRHPTLADPELLVVATR